MKYIYSLIAVAAALIAFIYHKNTTFDPNVFDAVLNVRISDTESKDFNFDFDRSAKFQIDEIIDYLNSNKPFEEENELKIAAKGKRPVKSYFSKKAHLVNSGLYSIRKAEDGFLVIYNGDIDDAATEETLEDAIGRCHAGAWNTMNIVVYTEK